jgi:UDP-N-acetyl-D-glucosamine dehydrogenase
MSSKNNRTTAKVPGDSLIMDATNLISKIESKEVTVGIVGLGYVGLPLVLSFAKSAKKIIGFDIDEKKINALIHGESYIRHIPAKTVTPLISSEQFLPTTDFNKINECDAILLCVPTPLNKNREPDMTYVEATGRNIAPHLRKGQLIVLESTTYPGTTEGLLKDILEKRSNLKAGQDFHLAYSPEREDPGNAHFETSTIPKVVGGLTSACTESATELYKTAIEKVIPVSSTAVAEMTKLLENIFRSVNIALVNELKVVCHEMGIDVWEVIHAASTKPFGFMPFYPGPGLGGHCIPIDPFYLTWKAREFGLSTRFIELAGEVNTSMPRYVIERTAEALNSHKKAMNGSNVLVLGLAYKKNVDDQRESPSLTLIEMLQERGAHVSYHDPYVPQTHKMREHNLDMASVELSDETLKSSDAVLISTDHDNVDYNRICELAPLVIDTRNATKNYTGNRVHIFKA